MDKKKEVKKTSRVKQVGTFGAGAALIGLGTTLIATGEIYGGCLVVGIGAIVLVIKRGYFFGD